MSARFASTMALMAALWSTGMAHAESAPEHTYALILTNNASLDLQRPNLSYADDDGAQYAELFESIVGATHRVTLLTRFDPGSSRLYPEWAARALPPTRKALAAAVAVLAERLRKDAGEGSYTSLYLIFAGHGDIANGTGFIELEDQRLTARELETEVIAALPADRIHLILDSCNSYFMLNPRKPGGKRWEVDANARARGLLDRFPHVGAIVSTSSEGVTYEWSELQSGIFSYELRSGLRGGADVNGDDRVSYDELTAFVRTANAAVVNESYRPRIFARAPAANGDELFARAPDRARRLTLPADDQRRVTLRGRSGIRVLDVHKEAGTPMTLWLGAPHPSVRVDERVDGDDGRPRIESRRWEAETATLDGLPAADNRAAGRGEHEVFRALFQTPFGAEAFSVALADPLPDDAASFGVTRRELERVEAHLSWMSGSDHATRIGDGFLGLTAGVLLVSAATVDLVDPDGDKPRGVVLGVGGATLTALAIRGLTVSSDAEDALARLDRDPPADEAERARAVLEIERVLYRSACTERTWRDVGGVASFVAAGGALVLLGALVVDPGGQDDDNIVRGTTTMGLLAGIAIANGVYAWTTEGPKERAWRLYEQAGQPEGLAVSPRRAAPSLRLGVGLGGVSLAASF